MMTGYNTKSPAVKRLMREAQELSQPTELYFAQPLEDNLFEWHFTIRGPEGSEFEGGIYHGQISLPTEYPMKPPNIMLLTPNGRFEQYRQICLSISGYHPETWCPSWSIRTALLAIIGFMPTSGAGAIGSMSISKEERKKLAVKSQSFVCDICGPTANLVLPLTSASSSTAKEAQEVASQFVLTDPKASKEPTPPPAPATEAEATPPAESGEKESTPPPQAAPTSSPQFPPASPSLLPSGYVTNPSAPLPAIPPVAAAAGAGGATGGLPRPAYWICYPVFVNNSAAVNGPRTSVAVSSGDRKEAPSRAPLSFEEWLKQVHEAAPTPAVAGSGSANSIERCVEPSEEAGSTSSPPQNQDENGEQCAPPSEEVCQCPVEKESTKSSGVLPSCSADVASSGSVKGSLEECAASEPSTKSEAVSECPVDIASNKTPVSSTTTSSTVKSEDECQAPQANQAESPKEDDDEESSSACHTTLLPETQSSQGSASPGVVCESSMPMEKTSRLPKEPSPQKACASVTPGPKVVPLPSKEATKEAAQRILRCAAQRHQQRLSSIQARLDSICRRPRPRPDSGSGMLAAGMVPEPRIEDVGQRPVGSWWVRAAVLALAFLLFALVIRRVMLMSTNGPCFG